MSKASEPRYKKSYAWWESLPPTQHANIDSGQYPLAPEKVEYARAFTRAAEAYSATGDMTGFQELGIFPPAGDPAYEELGISSPDSGGG